MSVLGSLLYVGTTWGCVIVAEGVSLRPIVVFRPFHEEVRVIQAMWKFDSVSRVSLLSYILTSSSPLSRLFLLGNSLPRSRLK